MGCSDNNSIIAIAETEPVTTSGDAADDPAIVINYSNPQQSIILGTDKRAGVYSYDLSGKKISYAALGEINNNYCRVICSIATCCNWLRLCYRNDRVIIGTPHEQENI